MTAEERWEYSPCNDPWQKNYRCTACGFDSEIESTDEDCSVCAAIKAAVEAAEEHLKEEWHQSTPTPAASPSSPEGSGTGTQEDDRDE